MKIIVKISFIFLIGNFCNAQENTVPDYTCEKKRVGYAFLCDRLESNRLVDDEESPYTYEYEQELARLAKADYEKDSEELYVKKINAYVTQCSCCLVCDTIKTQKRNISLLKVAAATGNLDFFQRAIRVYHYPLDVVDEEDGMNILDYVYEDIEFLKKWAPTSTQLEDSKKMFDIVKKAGGKFHKHKSLN